MDALAAQASLFEVAVLAGIGANDAQPQAAESITQESPANLSVGQLVTGRVVGNNVDGALVQIGAKLYSLSLPTPPQMGQTLNLQVFTTAPNPSFRLVSDLDTPPAASTQVQIGTPDSVAAVLQTVVAARPIDLQSLLNATHMADSADLGQTMATQIQQQFEMQTGSPSQSAGPSSSGSLPAPGAQVPVTSAPTAFAQAQIGPSTTMQNAPVSTPPNAAIASEPLSAKSADALSTGFESTPTTVIAASAASTLSTDMSAAARPANATASTLSPAIWQGQVWSGQLAELVIEPDRKRSAFEAPSLNAWRASLKLTLPQLGQINAQIEWNTAGLRISVDAADASSAEQLKRGSADLLDTLRALDLRVQSMGVRHA